MIGYALLPLLAIAAMEIGATIRWWRYLAFLRWLVDAQGDAGALDHAALPTVAFHVSQAANRLSDWPPMTKLITRKNHLAGTGAHEPGPR
ncbi:hypothetical protein [Blastococcus mobilis]|uniref:Uncharacterized protein n=1 Tax=Blastococcus mobilis TaxID=1938746 RepID=A0A239ANW5_9ACTN|nr:hypothetical protein [Blastococcus mobilis]SNR97386.1 hypothetical protein SAMN06272737_1521 [Blastococcus mobilis]